MTQGKTTKAKKPSRSGIAVDAVTFGILRRFRERVSKREGHRVSMSGAVARVLRLAKVK